MKSGYIKAVRGKIVLIGLFPALADSLIKTKAETTWDSGV
jgi:hypothetical protein